MNTTLPPVDQPSEYDDEDLSLAALIEKVQKVWQLVRLQRRYIWRSLAVTMPMGLLIAFGTTPEYTSSTKILPYLSGGGASGLSGLAGLAGIRVPIGGADQTITADLYPDVANTLDFRISVADSPIRFGTLRKPVSTVEYFKDVSRRSLMDLVRRYTIQLPGRFLTAIRPVPTMAIVPDSVSSRSPLASYDREYLRIVDGLKERLTVVMNRKTSVITIEGTMPDAYASADLVRTASERLMARIIDFESRKAGEQLRFVVEEQRRSHERFEAIQHELAVFTDRNRGTLSATAQIEAQRLQSEYNLPVEVYRQFSTELEQSRIKQNQNTPVFTTLEQVVVPNQRVRPRRTLIMLVAIFFGLVIGSALIAWRQVEERRVLVP
jgi:uncharacterized protein involved in exopolysaccharide biosynthesis